MRNNRIIPTLVKSMLISLSLLLVIGAFPVVKAQNTSTALVDNGQFEEVVPRNGQWTKEAPKNWVAWIDGKNTQGTDYSVEAKDGQLHFLGKEKLRAMVYQILDKKIDATKKYQLSYRVNSKDKTSYFYARIHERKSGENTFTTTKALWAPKLYGNQVNKDVVFEYQPSSRVDSIKLEFAYETGTGEVFVDDVKLEEIVQDSKEVIKNASFLETKVGTSPWTGKAAKDWTAWTPKEYSKTEGTEFYVNDHNEVVLSSSKEWRACLYQDILDFDNTKNYELSVKTKLSQKQGPVKLRILEKRLDANGKEEQVNSVSSNVLSGTSDDWQELKIQYSPLSLTQFLRIELFFETGTGTVLFKDLQLKELGPKEPFSPKEVDRRLEEEVSFPLDKFYTFRNPTYSYRSLDQKLEIKDGLVKAKEMGNFKVEVLDNGVVLKTLNIHVTKPIGDDYDRLLEQWNEIIVGNSSYKESNPAMKSLFDSFEKNSETYLTSMNQETGRLYLWEEAKEYERSKSLTTSFRHLEEIAKQITNSKSKYYRDPKAVRFVREGMEWLCTNVYNKSRRVIGNWWDYEIGTPRAINNTLSLMHAYFSKEEIEKYTEGIEYFVPDSTRFRVTQNDPFDAIGGNLIDMGRVKIISGLLRKNDEEIQKTVDAIQKVFVLVKEGQGFYADGSYIDHTNVAYTGAYGNVLIDGFSQLLPIIQASKSPLPSEKLNVVRHWIDKAFLPLIVHNELMDMSRGRSISRSNSEDHVTSVEVLRGVVRIFDVFEESYQKSLKSEVKTILKEDTFYPVNNNLKSYGDIANVEKLLGDSSVSLIQRPTKLSLFNHMDKVSYYNAKKDFGFGISMHSSRTQNFEMMNKENRKAWYTADGMTYLYNGDIAQYSQHYWPTVNPYYLSGTTVLNREVRKPIDLGSTMSSSFVGASKANESYGSVAMDFESQLKSLQAHKAWFICDDQIVALGTAISSADSHTTVDQRKLDKSKTYRFYVNGNLVDLSQGKKVLENVSSVFVDTGDVKTNVGYSFLTPTNLELSLSEQSGKWSEIREVTGEDDQIHKNEFYQIVISHQTNPSYAYSIVPSSSKTDFDQMMKENPIQVIKNTKYSQVVYDQRKEVYGVVKYTDLAESYGTTSFNKKGIYSVVDGNGSYYNPISMTEEKIEQKQVSYEVLENDLETLSRIRVNIPFSKFKAVFMDGKEVPPSHYIATEGSTIIQLKKDYVQTLSVGKHTITIYAKDGEVQQTFQVYAKKIVDTSDTHQTNWFVGWLGIGVVGALLSMKLRRKNY